MNSPQLTKRQRARLKRSTPRGLQVGLLTGSLVTLLGIICGLDAKVVLLRAVTSGVLLGSLCTIGLSVIRIANSGTEQNRSRTAR